MGLFDFLRPARPPARPQVPRVFISFAIEDAEYRDYLVQQAKRARSPFTFVDMSVKKNWPEHEWQDKCHQKIGRCHAVLVLLSNYTYHASGVWWEMKCAVSHGIPLVGMHVRKNQKFAVPALIRKRDVMEWNWPNLERFINRLT